METQEIKENKKLILSIWKKATKWQKDRIEKLCKRYDIENKVIDSDEGWTIYRFKKSKIEFTIPNGDNYDDYNLTGDALKFSEKYNDIIQETYSKVSNDLKKEGFEEYDSDEFFDTWEKDNIEYTISYYAKEDRDIDVSQKEFASEGKGEE